jgi:4-carboxymuconolactone decarboxylase
MTATPAGDWRETFPKLLEYTREVVFNDLWERPGLSKRDRSLAVVAALTALYRTDQLRAHIGRALDNGVARDEIVEVITHMAFYAGFPCAINGAAVASEVFAERGA